jgi:uncharacterized membrane protein YgcG
MATRGTRFFDHFFASARAIDRAFPEPALLRIEEIVTAAEAGSTGQIRVAIEAYLPAITAWSGYSARERSIDVFSQLRVWDTEHNNGVLIYLLMADKDVEIVADRHIHRVVGAAEWHRICKLMETHFARGEFEQGVSVGAKEIGQLLRTHFPGESVKNELPNRPYLYR